MKKLFFDIETIPCDEKTREIYLAFKKKGLKEEYAEEKAEEYILNTSFDGTYGRICCIGYIKEDDKLEKGVLQGDEKDIIRRFWDVAIDANLYIGHNIYEFDFPFIYKRSIIQGIRPPKEVSFARYRNFPIYDTMQEWSKWSYNSRTSLDTLAKVFGFPTSKDEMDGAMVWPKYQEGKIDEIAKYCMKDVVLTRQVYYRLLVEKPPFEPVAEPEVELEEKKEEFIHADLPF